MTNIVNNTTNELEKMSTNELETIVHEGENLHISTSRASVAQRILESRRHVDLIEATKNLNIKEKELNPNDLIIFYSWQSDLPNKTNRSLIEESLEQAVKKIQKDKSIKILPRLDKDTVGIPGSPNIATTILDKIDHSFLVVSDVSIINEGEKVKPTPNPNVLYELGYAVKSLGVENVIMVQNTSFGSPELLPFDLKIHRILTYECNQTANLSCVRNTLVDKLEHAIKLALENTKFQPQADIHSSAENFQDYLSSNKPVIFIETKLKDIVNQALLQLQQSNLYDYNSLVTSEEYINRKQAVEDIMKELTSIFFIFGRWCSKDQLSAVIRQFERLIKPPEPEGSYHETWENLAKYPGLLLFYSIGLGSIYNENIEVLCSFFRIRVYNRFTGEYEPFWRQTSVFNVFEYYKDLTKDNRYFPGSDELYKVFTSYFKDTNEEKYEDVFDTLEYLLSLSYGAMKVTKNNNDRFWVPMGIYSWRVRRRKIWETVSNNFIRTEEKWSFIKCFDLDKSNLEKIFQLTNEFISRNSARFW